MKVKAHLHLPKRKAGIDECISVAPYGHYKGQQTRYFGTVTLTNVRFQVSEPGRLRTLSTGQKNVHAWVVGDLINGMAGQHIPRRKEWRQARYNPKENPTFVDTETGEPVHSAHAAYMVGAKVYYI